MSGKRRKEELNLDGRRNDAVEPDAQRGIGGGVQSRVKPYAPEGVQNRLVRLERVAYSGPLPPASEVARYEETNPGMAERVLIMAERAQEGQLYLDKQNVRIGWGKIILSTVVSLSLVAAAIVAIILDPAWLAVPLGLGSFLAWLINEMSSRHDRMRQTP
ncbi:MAG: DUF2335 domain-containing protein [Bacteroidota bacterium]|nr:DUF2335 domain-containing protein [Bacteroidota bacterium]